MLQSVDFSLEALFAVFMITPRYAMPRYDAAATPDDMPHMLLAGSIRLLMFAAFMR